VQSTKLPSLELHFVRAVTIAADSSNKEAKELRLQYIKCRPVRDCYYTAEEAEAEDPLLVDNPAETTTDSKDDG
jgi:hypothetical protein